jgi:hypothetical protein
MCPISGGNWNNSSNAGVWAFNLNNVRGNSNNNVGFRSDSGSPRIGQPNGGTKGGAFRQPCAAKSVYHFVSGRAGFGLERQGVEA